MIQEYRRKNFLVSTDIAKLDVEAIHNYLSSSYWAQDEGLALFLLADSLLPGWQKKRSENPKFLLLIYCRALLSGTKRAVKSTPVLSMVRHKTVN